MRPYVEAFRLSMRRAWSTPGAIALSGLFYVLIMVVFAALWHVATSANHGFVAGYDYQALLWYLMATEAAVMAVPARRIEQIGDAIGDGTVETELLRPTLVLGIRLASELGEGSVQLLACWVFGTIVTYSFVGLPHNVAVVPLAFMSSVLAMVSNFVAVHAFAAVAFWLRDAKATWFLYQKAGVPARRHVVAVAVPAALAHDRLVDLAVLDHGVRTRTPHGRRCGAMAHRGSARLDRGRRRRCLGHLCPRGEAPGGRTMISGVE